jgi:hypothetical protein
MTTGTAVRLAILLLLLLTLIAVAPVAPPAQHAHGADPNDHYQAMYAGGVPGTDDVLPLETSVVCEDALDAATGVITATCIEAAGLGTGEPNRSYLDEQPAQQTIYASYDGIPDGPFKGFPSCLPDHKDTTEVGPFLFISAKIGQNHNYGPPVAVGPRGPPATMGCVRWHAQTAGNFIGRQVNQVGIDGTGRRAKVAEMHSITVEGPNPCYGKACAGEYIGRYLKSSFRGFVMEIATSAGQAPKLNPAQYKVKIVPNTEAGQEVWYLADFTPNNTDDKRQIEGHHLGQSRIPFTSVLFTRADGTWQRGIVAPADGSFIWNTCGTAFPARRDPGIPCVKTSIPAGLNGTLKARTVQNPNEQPIPTDWLGNRLLPLSYHWVKCLDDQVALVMPKVQDGDGNWLNPHQIVPALPKRILPYQKPECAYTIDIDRATEFPAEGLKGVPNGPPDPEPTGEPAESVTPVPPIDTPVPTAVPTATLTPVATKEIAPTPTEVVVPTATQVPADWRVVPQADVIHWWASDVYNVEDKPDPDFVDAVTAGVDWDFGGGAPRDGLPVDHWSSVHYGTWTGPLQGIRVRCDDDCRVVLGDEVLWDGPAYATREIPVVFIEAGDTPFRVEHRDVTGNSYIRVQFLRAPATPTPQPTDTPVPATATPEPPGATETPETQISPPATPEATPGPL